MFQYVALTDGTTLVVLNDNISYALKSYAPGAAFRSDNELGPLYADVVDTITFDAIGCTAAEAYDAAAAVNSLLDQAWRWANGETVTAVRLLIQAQQSTLVLPLEVCAKGRAPGAGAAPLSLPAQWSAFYGKYVIENITIQFVRRGQLLYPTAETGASTAAANPTVQSVTIATPTAISSPTVLQYDYQVAAVNANARIERAVVLTASAANRLQIYEAEGGVKTANVTTVADGANNARGGNVARYTPGPLTGQSITFTLSSWDSTAERMAVWAAVRNNSITTTSFTIQLRDDQTYLVASPLAIGPSSVTAVPAIVFLGILSNRLAFSTFSLLLTASAAADSLDIDYIVVQAVDDETSNALVITSPFQPSVVVGQVGFRPTIIDPKPLSEMVALISAEATGTPLNRRALGHQGDPTFYTRGSFVATMLATGSVSPSTTPTSWRATNAAGAVVDTVVSATRYGAYLVPR